jgi:peptide/nickel transport system permease protein
MQQYIIKRLALALLTLFGVSLLVFFGIRLIPGGVVDQILGESQVVIANADAIKEEVEDLLERQSNLTADEQARLQALRPQYDQIIANENQRKNIEKELGLDGPVWRQYFDWMGGILRLDFGESLRGQGSNNEQLKDRLPATLELSLMGLLISLLIALPIGTLSAVRQDTLPDYAGRSLAIGFLSIPQFWLATMIIVFAVNWFDKAVPSVTAYEQLWVDPTQNLKTMLFPFGYFIPLGPAVVLGVGLSGTVMRLTRAQMLEVLRQDYVRTAWAKGLRERSVVVGHALRNALIPVITVVGLQIPILVGGSVIVETIYNVRGIGIWFFGAISLRDYTIVQTVALLTAAIVILSNLLVDLTYAWIDPRIKYS